MQSLILFGVAGLERGRGSSGGIGSFDDGRKRRSVLLSHSIAFHDRDGRSITVTSQRSADDGRFASMRKWAPMNTYLGTPEGRDKFRAKSGTGQPMEPPNVEWRPVSIPVDGHQTDFEVCEFPDGWWAAIGQVPEAAITIDSRGVPLDGLHLERVPEHPVPALPDLGNKGQAVRDDLAGRFSRLPLHRVCRMSDYWALRSVEADHVHVLAGRHSLSDQDRRRVEAHWLARIDAELAPVAERFRFESVDAVHNSRISRHLRGHRLVHQLWWNTLGPGAKTWVGNRLAPFRRFMFRLRWKP